MTAPVIKGWCPGALRPMLSGDGWVVRVRPHGGRLTSAQAAGIARLAMQCGSGVIDLSARANIQVRGVRQDAHQELIAGLRALGLADDSAEAEARRNLIVTPFWRAGDGTSDIAARIEAALARPDAPAVPGKFGFALDTGDAPVLRDASADIRIERADGALIVAADGADTGAEATADTAPDLALDLARWFLASGGAPQGRGRMAAHLARGATLPFAFRAARRAARSAPRPGPGLCPEGALVGFAFGQTNAATLAALATKGDLRLTPWRMVLIEWAETLPILPGVLTDPHDPLLRMVACTGAPGCPQAFGATRPLALHLAPAVPVGETWHVAGCTKGCAHPGPAAITLVATACGFDLIRAGSATDTPERTDLTADTLTTLLKAADAPQL